MAPNTLSASVDLLHILIQYAATLGIDEKTIAAATGTNPALLRQNEGRIPLGPFHLIWSFVAERSKDPDFGLHFGEQSHTWLRGHLLYAMMMNCRTAQEAIEKNFRYHNLLTDIIRPRMLTHPQPARLTWEMGHPDLPFDRHLSESVLALLVCMLTYLTQNQFQAKGVRFAHARPGNTTEHERIFRAPLTFDQKRNEILLNQKDLDHPILLANPEILKGLERLVQKALQRTYRANTWQEKVAQILFKTIVKENETDINRIARDLALTPRTLQLKLQKEGTTYRKLLDGVRKEIAVGLLENETESICEVALLLGFSDQSAFQHAFKRWTGDSPGAYRKRLRHSPT